jgi:aconitate hydratase
LVGMGVLPLELKRGETRESLGLTGHEVFEIERVASMAPRGDVTVRAKSPDGKEKKFAATVRVDTPEELCYYQHGGILQYVLRNLLE